MKNTRQRVVTYSDDQKIFVRDTDNLVVTVQIDNAEVVKEQSAGELTIGELQAIMTKPVAGSDTITNNDMSTNTDPENKEADE